ncbi:hypothetical protein Ancab_025502 [Ancistrocladus abbreviatus]
MRLPQPASVSSSKRGKHSRFGTRTKKKHKRLDAICENAFNQNQNQNRGIRVGSNVGSTCRGESLGDDSELRRSSRVRRAPVFLDSSPPPSKKRQKVNKNGRKVCGGSVEGVKGKVELKRDLSPCSNSMASEEELGVWRSRLRSRARNVSLGMKENDDSPRAKRKLYEDPEVVKKVVKPVGNGLGDKKMALDGVKSTVVKSKRPGRIRASIGHEVELHDDSENESEKAVIDVLGNRGDEHASLSGSETGDQTDEGLFDNTVHVVEKVSEAPGNMHSEERIVNDCVKILEQDKPFDLAERVVEAASQRDAMDVVALPTGLMGDEGNNHLGSGALAKAQENALEDDNAAKVDNSDPTSTAPPSKPRIKEGRRCGLCGGGLDGKPPKRLVHDTAGSDHEAYTGSSASEEPNYDIWDGFGDDPSWVGKLLGPINDRYGIAGIWVHQQCAVWSPEVYFAGLGCLKNVRAALCRGRQLKCTRCGRPGATIGCRVDRCPRTYHLPCARATGCIFDHRKFLISCTDHRHLFQPRGYQYLQRIKKLKAKKMKLEMRKLSNDVWRKDLEAEEKWLEKCGEDEEFLKRETKRLQRDMLRIAPVYIGGSSCEGEKLSEGWESVAGLQDVIQCMKEVVILPLLYPEFFKNLGLAPPRGVLLHGYPGTGKTLVVRALIGSCARGDKRIAYFARKGADCLGKYVGDAERQLRLLFQVAERCQPSIIFFDEIDGLAPVRTRHQDQTHSSVVSTLLALMDGLKSRGSVIVIGATNRPDAVDPALRRPGRFDREIYFPLPSTKDRASILALHTRKWPKPVGGPLLQWIATRTAGFAGADLQALCAQAAIAALKRSCPLQEILSTAGERAFEGKLPQLPAFVVEERDWLEALSSAPPPCSRREAGMAANEVAGSPLRTHLIPCLLQPLCSLLISVYLDDRIWLPSPLFKAAEAIKCVIVSAAKWRSLCTDEWWCIAGNLVQQLEIGNEIIRNLSTAGILVGDDASYFCNLSNDVSDDVNARYEPIVGSGLPGSLCYASRPRAGYRILIAGSPRSGQKHLASCLLQYFVGSIEIQKIDLATISQEGDGDMVQGMTRILMKCASMKSCVIFMPRIDLWAIETCNEASQEDGGFMTDDESFNGKMNSSGLTNESGVTEPSDELQSASQTWSSFVEQMESISVSASLMILATSEVPCPALPHIVRQFFATNSSSPDASHCSEHTTPRIAVQLDGRFNHDMVIQSAASELSGNLIKQFLQVIHHRAHLCLNSKKMLNDCNEGKIDMGNHRKDQGSAEEPEAGAQCPQDSVMKVPVLPNSRSVKWKSQLFLAITTFGYQILRYPHFAEICWVTSKLKDGPCADIRGPWKGWPFNSCVVRSNNSLEKEAVAGISNNTEGRDKFSLVRGLIAVGLLAYRGVYTSLAEVSSEVRKVLELLVGQISAKIQAGKDRYQYVRILSQVAYIEDMVNCWTYSLRSLELDAQTTTAMKLITSESAANQQICALAPTHVEGEQNVPIRSFDGADPVEGSLQGFANENFELFDLNKGCDDACHDNSGELLNTEKISPTKVVSPSHFVAHNSSKGEFGSPEKESPQKVISAGQPNPLPDIDVQSSVPSGAVNGSGGTTSYENNGRSEASRPEHYEYLMVAGGDTGPLKQSDRSTPIESLVHPNKGAQSSDELECTEFCSSSKLCDQSTSVVENDILAGQGAPNVDVDVNLSSQRSGYIELESGILCLYQCCIECVRSLHEMVQKIVAREWALTGGSWTVEDFHDQFASLSSRLCSAVGKLYVPGCFSSLHGREMVESQKMDTSQCKIPNSNLIRALECTCHSRKRISSEENSSPCCELGFNSQFIYRDGVLVPANPEKDVTFHCKYETLCLSTLRELIAITRQP